MTRTALLLALAGCIEGVSPELDPFAPYDDAAAPAIPGWVMALQHEITIGDPAELEALEPLAQDHEGIRFVLAGPELTLLGPSYVEHHTLIGEMPDWTSFHYALDVPVASWPYVVLPPDGDHAFLVASGGAVDPIAIESAAPHLSDPDARDATVALRWMQTCPISRATCLLFGPPAAVSLAIDPALPPGGVFLDHVATYEAREGAPVLWTHRLSSVDGDLAIDVLRPEALDVGPNTWGSALRVSFVLDHRQHRSFAVPFDLDGMVLDGLAAGVVATSARLAVYLWDSETSTLTVAFHDRASGARLESPFAVQSVPYSSQDYGDAFSFLRPVLVESGDDVIVAIHRGGETAILFERGQREGHEVEVAIPSELVAGGSTMEHYPAIYRLEGDILAARDGAWQPLRDEVERLELEGDCTGP